MPTSNEHVVPTFAELAIHMVVKSSHEAIDGYDGDAGAGVPVYNRYVSSPVPFGWTVLGSVNCGELMEVELEVEVVLPGKFRR